jgi:hypothetical protein
MTEPPNIVQDPQNRDARLAAALAQKAQANSEPASPTPKAPANWKLRVAKLTDFSTYVKKVPDRALILRAHGPLDIYEVKGGDKLIPAESGTYVSETFSRFWLPEGLKRGWVRIYCEQDPEPVTNRIPVGYFAQDLAALGITLPDVVDAGFTPPKAAFEFKSWMQWAMIGLVVLVGGGYIAYKKWFGESSHVAHSLIHLPHLVRLLGA